MAAKQQRDPKQQARARSKPRIAPNNFQVPTAKVCGWFDYALDIDDPKPSRAACERLAREFQIIVNRHNNAEEERKAKAKGRLVPFGKLKDVSLPEEVNKRVRKVVGGAKQMLADASALEDFAGGYQWGAVSLEDVKDVLQQIILSPEASAALATQTLSAQPSLRRPREAWHATGREMALLIRAVMRDMNYNEKRLKMEDEESVTACVGAEAIKWTYAIDISPAGFASAMKGRGRSKAAKANKFKSYNERFPDAARIKIAD